MSKLTGKPASIGAKAKASIASSVKGYAGGNKVSLSNSKDLMRAKAIVNPGSSAINPVNSNKVTTTEVGGTVYNVNMTVNGSNSNPQEIANLVMREFENKTNKNNKTNKVPQ